MTSRHHFFPELADDARGVLGKRHGYSRCQRRTSLAMKQEPDPLLSGFPFRHGENSK
jgi:hypothetical protein